MVAPKDYQLKFKCVATDMRAYQFRARGLSLDERIAGRSDGYMVTMDGGSVAWWPKDKFESCAKEIVKGVQPKAKENGFKLPENLELRKHGNAVTIVYRDPAKDVDHILCDDIPLVILQDVVDMLASVLKR